MAKKYLIEETTLTSIANAIRSKTGGTNPIMPSDMAIEIDNGVNTSDATAIADEIFKGKTAYIADGKVTGTFTIDNELNTQDNLISQIQTALQNKATNTGTDTSDATAVAGDILSGKTAYAKGQKVTGTIATKTSSNLTASGATVTVPAGYYASQATKSVATATQATPSVSIDSAGKITATATQTAGYVSAGTKTGTKQLTTQAAKTITPSTSSQTAVASGVYTTGDVKVNPIPSTYIIPTGTKTITTNGTHDVKSYASATVNVAGEDVTTETTAYTNKLAILETAITALETELAGKASGGSGGGGFEIVPCTITDNGMYEPGMNEYIISCDGLNLSTRKLVLFMFDNDIATQVVTGLCRSNLNDDFTVIGASKFMGVSITFSYTMTIFRENEIVCYGKIPQDVVPALTFFCV